MPILLQRPPYECSHCGKVTINSNDIWQYGPFKENHWYAHRWTCKHKDIKCPKCEKEFKGCATCGRQEEYT